MEATFLQALRLRDFTLLDDALPRWLFLQWLGQQGYLLHGSNRGDIQRFEPRTPIDLSPDDFSKRTAVFAASDGVWAMMYALVDRTRVARILNMALQVREVDGWSAMRYFLSLASRDETVTSALDLLREGSVYVLAADGFERMPSYHWPGLGDVLEPHWANSSPVSPIMRIPVSPKDYPLSVRLHDAERVDALASVDPWNFPWLV